MACEAGPDGDPPPPGLARILYRDLRHIRGCYQDHRACGAEQQDVPNAGRIVWMQFVVGGVRHHLTYDERFRFPWPLRC